MEALQAMPPKSKSPAGMAPVRKAVAAARGYVQAIVGSRQANDLAVEEVEHDTRKKRWRIVLGFYIPPPKLPSHVLSYPVAIARERRVLFVDDRAYQVTSMKRLVPPNE